MLNIIDAGSARRARGMRGVTLMELCVVILIALVLTGIALPSIVSTMRSYRGKGDARQISGELALARMRAASDFTQTRLFVNLTNNTYRVDIWSKAGNATNPTGCWQTETATTTCDAPTSASVSVPQDIALGQNSAMGYGNASSAPPSTQTTFGQASNCMDNAGNAIASTACVTFNSRGIPVTPGNPLAPNNTATSNDAIYFSSQEGITYGVTVLATGKTALWVYNGGGWTQQ